MPNTPDRERNQPQERKKLGLLEKKKDYQKRSQDYNKKKATLKSLRAKAAEFNEDEFAYGMLSRQMSTKWSHGSKWSGLVNGDRGNKALSVDAARLLKTQDVGYLRTMRSVAHKEVKQREERLALAVALAKQSSSRGGDDELEFDFDDDDDMDDEDDEPNAAKRPTRIVFMDDVDERDQAVQAQRDAGKDEAEDDDEKKGADGDDGDELTEKEKIAMLQRKLQNSKKRLKALVDAEEELQAQRARMAKTPSYSGITKSGKKVKVRERKR